jgi:uncharacterized alpha-E superfamily protein
MILSRVADSLYWLGRYLERSENVTRLLLVTEELTTEVAGLDETLARSEWDELAAVLPGPPLPPDASRSAHGLATAMAYALAIDPGHPNSLLFSLRRARDNARGVREALTVEVFVNLNDTYHELESRTRRQIADPAVLRSALTDAHRGVLSTVGAIAHTLTRDAGWRFLRLGETLERVYRTAVILRVKLPALLGPEPKTDLALVYTRWRSLLRSLSSLENYRKTCGAHLEPTAILQFLLFDAHTPRSLRYGVGGVKDYLERVAPGGQPNLPARIMGKVHAELVYQGADLIERGETLGFLDHVLGELERAHDALSAAYFGT